MTRAGRFLALTLASVLAAACGKAGEPALPAERALSYADSLPLYVSGSGLTNSAAGIGLPGRPTHSADFVAAFASAGASAAAAINRSGAVVLDIDARARTLRMRDFPSPEFADRTVGSIFADADGSFLVSLYRHPDETGPDSGGSLLRLDTSAATWEPAALPPQIDAASLYSMHRGEDGGFLLTTRRQEGDSVVTTRWLVGPDGESERIDLATFESLLAPRPARAAPPALGAALESLAAKSGKRRILAFARNPRGDGTWYALGDGPPESAVEVVAALDGSGAFAFAAFPEGPALTARERDGTVELLEADIVVPEPGATWNGALIHGDSEESLVLVLSWWVERFPDTAGAGLLVRPFAGPARAAAL